MIYRIGFEDFLRKVKKIKEDIKVLYETSGNFYIFYLPAQEADYCAVRHKNELTYADKMNLANITIPAVRIKDKIKLDEPKKVEPQEVHYKKYLKW